MKAKFYLSLFYLGFSTLLYSQDTLNRFDKDSKKDGPWILYYNSYWKVVKDSSKASYYAYTYYDHGMRTITEATWGSKNGKLIDSSVSNQHMGKIKLLDGRYTWYDKNGRFFSTHYFNKGKFISCKQYYPSGKVYLDFDYMKTREGQPHTYHMYIYEKNGTLESDFHVRKCEGCRDYIK